MNRFHTICALTLAAIPFVVSAQTANTPGGSAATGTPLDQTKPAGRSGPTGNSATSPDVTNPSGSLSRGAAPSAQNNSSMSTGSATTGGAMAGGTSTGATSNGGGMSDSTGKTKAKAARGKPTPTGDDPTYPGGGKDGKPVTN